MELASDPSQVNELLRSTEVDEKNKIIRKLQSKRFIGLKKRKYIKCAHEEDPDFNTEVVNPGCEGEVLLDGSERHTCPQCGRTIYLRDKKKFIRYKIIPKKRKIQGYIFGDIINFLKKFGEIKTEIKNSRLIIRIQDYKIKIEVRDRLPPNPRRNTLVILYGAVALQEPHNCFSNWSNVKETTAGLFFLDEEVKNKTLEGLIIVLLENTISERVRNNIRDKAFSEKIKKLNRDFKDIFGEDLFDLKSGINVSSIISGIFETVSNKKEFSDFISNWYKIFVDPCKYAKKRSRIENFDNYYRLEYFFFSLPQNLLNRFKNKVSDPIYYMRNLRNLFQHLKPRVTLPEFLEFIKHPTYVFSYQMGRYSNDYETLRQMIVKKTFKTMIEFERILKSVV